MKKILFLSFCLSAILTHAQVLHPAEWKTTLSQGTPKSGEEAEVIFDVKIDQNWYLYSSDFDPDLGPMVTEFTFEENDTYERIGELIPVNPSRKYDSLWEGEYTYFKDQARFTQKVRILKDQYRIAGSYTYQVCSDIDGKCIPFDEEFVLKNSTKAATPKVAITSTDGLIGSDKSILDVFIIALIAGLIALATPCVYPMIPMTVSIFMKQGGSKGKTLSMAAVFGVSIIVLFTVIGFLVSLIWGFSALNELSTNWLFNLILFAVFVLFALSFFGLFEITLPHQLVNKIDQQADRGGYLGVIFMAITLVVVSFSCTVPIVGTALLTALNDGNILNGTVAMFGFSLAFAVPFTAFALFPGWLKSMPKSGGWLNSVKVVLGFLELALALKFLSVADLAYHWGILDREIFLALWIVIFTLLGFYLLGKIRFKGDGTSETVSIGRLFLAIGVFSFVAYLTPGMFGAPLKALAGFLPPLTTHDFNLVEVIREQKETAPTAAINQQCEEPKFDDFLEFPHGLTGYFDYDQAVACSKATGKPIFIDFTGHGCVNCREMEQRVWSEPAVLKILSEDYILLALYVDDKTTLPEDQWYTSPYDNKVKKTIGKKNSDFQIRRYNNNAQPFYVLLSPEEELLVEPRAYDLNVDNFVTFLEAGLHENKKRS